MPQETQTLFCNICGFQSSRPGVTECPQCGQRNPMTTSIRAPAPDSSKKKVEKEEKQSKTDKK